MSQSCDTCGKKPVAGHRVSHAHNVTNRQFKPNLRRVRLATPGGGSRRTRVCTRCLRSEKIRKVVR